MSVVREASDRLHHVINVERLTDEVIYSKTLRRRVRARGAADRDHPRATSRPAIFVQEFRSVHIAPEVEIEEDDVGFPYLDLAKREIAARGRSDLIAAFAE